MMPYLLKIGSFELRVYSLMIIIGLIISIYFIRKKAKFLGYKPELIENLIIAIFLCALIGGRLYYVFLKWDFYGSHLSEIPAIWHGGIAIHGGIIGGIIGAALFSHLKKIKTMLICDLIAPFLLFSQGLGRFGNFANGEAHGVPVITPPDIIFRFKPVFTDFWNTALAHLHLSHKPESISRIGEMVKNGVVTVPYEGKEYILREYAPWGISFTDKYMPAAYLDFGTLAVHPTFFYEMILNFIGAAIIFYFWRKDELISTGKLCGLYFIFYGLIRSFVTMFRADDLMIGFMRAPHLASAVMIAVGVFLILRKTKTIKEESEINN